MSQQCVDIVYNSLDKNIPKFNTTPNLDKNYRFLFR